MNWPVLRLLWALKSPLLSLEMQKIDTFLTKVPNFAEGSSHIAANPVILGGAGMHVTGDFVADSADITIPSGHVLDLFGTQHVRNLALVRVHSGGTIQVDASAGLNVFGVQRIESTGLLHVIGGGAIAVDAAADINLDGALNVKFDGLVNFESGGQAFFDTGSILSTSTGVLWSFLGTGTIIQWASNAKAQIAGTSKLEVLTGGTAEIQVGGNLDVFGTATVKNAALLRVNATGNADVYGTATIKGMGTLKVENTGIVDINAATVDLTGADVSYTGTDETRSSTCTSTDDSTIQRGNWTKHVGDTAYVGRRIIHFDGVSGRPNGDSNITINAYKWDFVLYPALTGDRTLRLAAMPDPPNASHFLIIRKFASHDLTIKDDASDTVVVTLSASSSETWAIVYWDTLSSAWVLAAGPG